MLLYGRQRIGKRELAMQLLNECNCKHIYCRIFSVTHNEKSWMKRYSLTNILLRVLKKIMFHNNSRQLVSNI